MRAAATSLPPAEMPVVAQLRPMFRRVQVQVVVDEKGNVTSAQATSPEEVFNEAAEAAARKATFSPEKLSEKPARLFSLITYEFASDVASPESTTVAAKAEPPSIEPVASAPPPTPSTSPIVSSDEKVDSLAQGVLHLNNGQYAKAEEALKQFVYHNPDDAQGYNSLGFAYFGQQKYVEAIAAFKIAMKLRPDLVDAATYYAFGSSLHSLRKYSDAVKAFKQGIYVLRAAQAEAGSTNKKGSPSLFHFQYNLGVTYQTIAANSDAIKAFKEAAALDPKAAEPHYGLGLVYLSLGDKRSIEKEQKILQFLILFSLALGSAGKSHVIHPSGLFGSSLPLILECADSVSALSSLVIQPESADRVSALQIVAPPKPKSRIFISPRL